MKQILLVSLRRGTILRHLRFNLFILDLTQPLEKLFSSVTKRWMQISTGRKNSSLFLKVNKKVKKDKRQKNKLTSLLSIVCEKKREVGTTYFTSFGKNLEVKAIHYFRFGKSELHIECQKGSQNYILVKSELHICLWKTCVS